MIEFLIRRTDGEWFDLPANLAEVLRPSSVPSHPVAGKADHGIKVRGCLITFSYEDPGIQVSCEGNTLSEKQALQIVSEVADNLTAATGQQSRVVPL